MKESTHGGDLVSARVLWAGEVLDFSANLNPLGMPEGVRRAAAEGVEEAVHYPDPLCRELRRAIARRDGADPAQVICGAGAAELIFPLCLALRPRRALVTAPTFSEYEAAVSAAGCTVVRHILDRARNFDLTGAVLDELTPELDLAFFCTPNNPTGRVIDRGLLEAILEKSRAAGVRLVVDECFLALSDGGEAAGLAGSPTLFEFLDGEGKLRLAAGFGDGSGAYIACDRTTGERLWRAQTLGVVVDAAAHFGGYLYLLLRGAPCQALCLEARSGDLVWWNRGRRAGVFFFSDRPLPAFFT